MSANQDYSDELLDMLRRSRDGAIPADFGEWPLENQADWLCRRHNRIGLIEMLLAAHSIEPEYQSDGSKEIITKEELAKLYIKTVGVI